MPIADASRRIITVTYWSRGARVTTNVWAGSGQMQAEEDARGNEEPIYS